MNQTPFIADLINLFLHEDIQVRRKADQLLRSIIDKSDYKATFAKICEVIVTYREFYGTNLQKKPEIQVNAGLRLITYSARNFRTIPELYAEVERFGLSKYIIQSFDSPDISTRKTAVSCFIEFLMLLKDTKFQNKLGELDDLKINLVMTRMRQRGSV